MMIGRDTYPLRQRLALAVLNWYLTCRHVRIVVLTVFALVSHYRQSF